jgi:hypothetical protein
MAENRANLKTVISADSTQFNSALGKATLRAQSAGMGIARGVGRATMGIAKMGVTAAATAASVGLIGGALVGAVMIRGIKSAADLGGKISDLSAQTGIAAGEIMVMQRALQDNGIAGDKVGTIINKMQKAIFDAGQGIGTALPALEELGLNLSDLSKMSPEKQFEAIQRSISAIEDPTRRAGLAMQIFGKSGGELLTLFADGKAFDNAGKFVGVQAEIMNRSAVLFDAISDKLGRVPDKLQGFFVGFLEPVADTINGLLDKFESFDFASLGLKIGESFMRAVEMFRGAIDSLSIGEMFELAALTLKVKLMEAGNALWGIISGVMAVFESGGIYTALETAALRFKTILLEAAAETADSLAAGAGGKLKIALENAAHFARGAADVADAEREAIIEGNKSEKSIPDKFKEGRDAAKDVFKIPEEDLYEIERGFQKIRVAADVYSGQRKAAEASRAAAAAAAAATPAAATADGSGISGPPKSAVADQMGPGKSLMNDGYSDMFARQKSSSSAGFGGLAGLYGMQTKRISGGKVGADSVFNKDRERLGVGSGLVTGGLGEKRRLNTSKDDKDAKKKISLEEQSIGLLEGINRGITQSLSVN